MLRKSSAAPPLLSSCENNDCKSQNNTADRVTGAERDIDLMRHRSKARPGRGDEVVRGRRSCGKSAEARGLLANGVHGRDSAAETDVGDWLCAVQTGDCRKAFATPAEFSGHESANAGGY